MTTPKIKFFYSKVYDEILTGYEGKSFDKKQIKEVQEFISKIQRKWDKLETPVLTFLAEITGIPWKQKEIRCYVVKYLSFTGISQPLTLRINPDINDAITTIIHELVHILLVSAAKKKWETIFQKLNKKFPQENFKIILHIYVNFVELQVLKKFFKKSTMQEIINTEKKFKDIGKAWQIVLKEEKNLHKLLK